MRPGDFIISLSTTALVKNGVEFLYVGDAFGFAQVEKLPLQRLAVNAHLRRRQRVVQWNGGAVLDAFAMEYLSR